jgi:class 3 adenylate cyclase/tetratricopeptide (TPR) repeat protein
MHSWGRYLAQDRLGALARGEALSEHAEGSALFADIDGFTPLTERLVRELGARLGAEELARRIDAVYEVLIAACEAEGGSVVGFAGDALTCWFAGTADGACRALRCAQAMQRGGAARESISVKVGIGSGAARRFVAGDPRIQLLDALAGAAVARMAMAEQLAGPGEIVVDARTEAAGPSLAVGERRVAPNGEVFLAVGPSIDTPSIAQPGTAAAPLPGTLAQRGELLAERLRPWLLPQVYEAEREGHGVFLTELRPTVALFLRFDGIDYAADPAAAQQLDAVVRCAQAVTQRHDGTLLQLTLGDKGSYAYLAFGAPVAHEDDAARAVRAAWQLREALQPFAFLTSVQIGIAPGVSRTGAYGSRSRATYGALGDGANLAARLMSAARHGQILLAQSVQREAAREFSLAATMMLALKGHRDPVAAQALGAPLPRQAMQLREERAGPLFGRRAELARLESALDSVLQGRPQVIDIVGEAGVGKSRLIMELTAHAHARGFAIYGAACSASGTTTPYFVWKPICRALLELDARTEARSGDASTAPRSSFEAGLRDLAPHRVPAMPVLGPLLDEPVADNDFTRRLTPEDRRNLLTATIEDMLKAAARRRPLLVVLEDRHWMDGLSSDLLKTLTDAQMDVPLCVVSSCRNGDASGSPHGPRSDGVLQVALGALAPDDARELVRNRLGWPAERDADATALADALNARAEGNPFYLQELLNFERERGRTESDPAALARELPSSLHALILSSIDRLTETQRVTLKAASVIGRAFRVDWLHACCPSLGAIAQVQSDLEALCTVALTRQETREPPPAYLFRHVVIRDVAYDSLPRSTRAQLHEQLAAFVETSRSNPDLDLLAYHYGLSDRLDKQREYFRRAGDAAVAAYANEAAIAYFDRLAPLLNDPHELFDVHMRCAGVFAHVGRSDKAAEVARHALSLAEAGLGERCVAEASLQLGEVLWASGQFDEAHELLQRAAAIWHSLGDTGRLSDALARDAAVHRMHGQPRAAVAAAQSAIATARASGAGLAHARALAVLGWASYALGDAVQARNAYDEALSLARSHGDLRQIALALQDLAVLESRQGRIEQAQPLYEECLEKATQIGLKHTIDAVNLNYGTLLSMHGPFAQARARLERAVKAFGAGGSKPHLAGALQNLGVTETSLGDFEAAQRHLEEARAMFRTLGIRRGEATAAGALGDLLVAQGRYADAKTMLFEALQMRAQAADNERDCVNSFVSNAALLVADGHAHDALRLHAAAERLATQMGMGLGAVAARAKQTALEQAGKSLDQQALQQVWAEGTEMPFDDALALALRAVADAEQG